MNKKLPKITNKQKKFCDAYIENGGNWVQASKIAYNIWSKGGKVWKENIINTANAIAGENLQKPAIKHYLQQFGEKAGNRIQQLIDSDREQIALQASIYTYDQIHWKATQKIEQKSQVDMNVDIQSASIDDLLRMIKTN